MDVGHAPEIVRDAPLHFPPELPQGCVPLRTDVDDDLRTLAITRQPDARMAVELALDQSRDARHLTRGVARVAGDHLRRDARLAVHQSLGDCRTSSVASGLARKRNGTNVVPSPGETCITVARVRYTPSVYRAERCARRSLPKP